MQLIGLQKFVLQNCYVKRCAWIHFEQMHVVIIVRLESQSFTLIDNFAQQYLLTVCAKRLALDIGQATIAYGMFRTTLLSLKKACTLVEATVS